jgi:hypothetical protein
MFGGRKEKPLLPIQFDDLRQIVAHRRFPGEQSISLLVAANSPLKTLVI